MINRNLIIVIAVVTTTSTFSLPTAVAVEAITNSGTLADAKSNNEKSQSSKPSLENAANKKITIVDTEAETQALQLVHEHLPEFEAILKRLQDRDQPNYRKAITDFARSARRLATAKKRSEELYELEVELLRNRMQTKLLTAKIKVRDSADARKELKDAVAKLLDAEARRLEYDVRSFEEKFTRAKAQLDAAKNRLANKTETLQDEQDKIYRACIKNAGQKNE